MTDIDILKVPAFQRKKSIEAKAKKKRKTLKTRISSTAKKISKSNPYTMTDIPVVDIAPNIEDFNSGKSQKSLLKEKAEAEIKRMTICGSCEGYFEKIKVAVIKVTSPFRIGSTLIFETSEGLFEQKINSIQQDGKSIKLARSGSEVGIKVFLQPKLGGTVYKNL